MPSTDLTELQRQSLQIENIPISNELKYLIVNRRGILSAIVFPKFFTHIGIFSSINTENGFNGFRSLFSAGFCNILMDGSMTVKVWGESDSIKSKFSSFAKERGIEPFWVSRVEDPAIIRTSYGLGPWTYLYPLQFEEEKDND